MTVKEIQNRLANRHPRVTDLARTFPCFAKGGAKGAILGLEPFDAEKFRRGLAGSSHGEWMAGMFILSVFYGTGQWDFEAHPEHGPQDGNFDVHEALGTWDDDYRAAFAKWTAAPWWP